MKYIYSFDLDMATDRFNYWQLKGATFEEKSAKSGLLLDKQQVETYQRMADKCWIEIENIRANNAAFVSAYNRGGSVIVMCYQELNEFEMQDGPIHRAIVDGPHDMDNFWTLRDKTFYFTWAELWPAHVWDEYDNLCTQRDEIQDKIDDLLQGGF